MQIEKLKQYVLLMRLHKPIGILLLMWPTLWAVWLASAGKPNSMIIAIFVAGVFLTRSAGCIINDYADRDFDGWVKRTRERPLAAGRVSVREALVVFCLLMLCAFSLVLFLNAYTIFLAVIGAILTVLYPFLKRITHLPQVGLGFAFSWGVPMAFAAENNFIPASAWLLFLTAVIWPVIYDTMYAMTDREDDLKIGVKSTAILFGHRDVIILGILQMVFLFCLLLTGYAFDLLWPYYLGVFIAAGFFVYQQYLMKDRNPQACFNAFLNNHWVGLILFLGIVGSESL